MPAIPLQTQNFALLRILYGTNCVNNISCVKRHALYIVSTTKMSAIITYSTSEL